MIHAKTQIEVNGKVHSVKDYPVEQEEMAELELWFSVSVLGREIPCKYTITFDPPIPIPRNQEPE